MGTKAVVLLSGGLDSGLALRLVHDLGVECVALHMKSVFSGSKLDAQGRCAAEVIAAGVGVPLRTVDFSENLLEIVRSPRHGYGKNMNPCIDCRIASLGVARELMDEIGADFLVTGEVLGQRPMSQRREAMAMIEREAGVEGLVLRPLSAQNLPPTKPERDGLVDRSKLLGIRGRSRKEQIRLAGEWGVAGYTSPAGGCLLTDPGFSLRLRELMDHRPDFTLSDVELLKFGRHFRLGPRTKAVVGREQEDNDGIEALAAAGDVLFRLLDRPGPSTLLRGDATAANECYAAELTVFYAKVEDDDPVIVEVEHPHARRAPDFMEVRAVRADYLESLRINV